MPRARPLAAGARDAVTALFYVRTLPLSEGAELVIPVNDAGRNLTVRAIAEGTETRDHTARDGGGPAAARDD